MALRLPGLGLGIARVRGPVTPADIAADHAARVFANGGNLSTAEINAESDYVYNSMASGNWAKRDRIGTLLGDSIAAILVPLKVGSGGAVDLNTGFVSSDYSRATGLTGGAGRMLDTSIPTTTAGVGAFPKSNFGMGVMVLASPTTGNLGVIGGSISPTGDTNRFYVFPGAVGIGNVGGVPAGTAAFAAPGYWSVELTGAANVTAYSKGASVLAVTTWNGQGPQPGTLTVMSIGGTAFPATGVRLGGYDTGGNQDQVAAQSAWATLYTAVGRA